VASLGQVGALDTEQAGSNEAFRSCHSCGAWNLESDTACRDCHKALADDHDIKFSLVFGVETCPGCGRVSPSTQCLHCGAEIPPGETSAIALARQKAFVDLRRRADDLRRLYDHLPEPHIPVAADQYAMALADSRIIKRAGIILRSLHRLHELGLNDEREVGSTARRRLARLVTAVEQLYRETEELAWFRPPAVEVMQAREAMVAVGRQVTEAVATLLAALTASSVQGVVAPQQRFQELLYELDWVDHFAAATQALEKLPAGDIDTRVSVALGTEIDVTDDLGLLDPARVLAAFAGDEDPFTPLARASVGFLSHLTTTGVDDAPPESAALALPALGLALLDRPLPAHSLARMVLELLKEAERGDGAATAALFERTSNEGPRIFAAAKRIHDDLRYLAAGYAHDDHDVLARVLGTYKRLAESSFRNYVWLIIDAQSIASGGAVSQGSRAPTLGKLEHRLSAWSDPLSKRLARAADAVLRNAEAHEDFRLDADTGELVFEGKRMSLERFEERIERLVAATVALDVAFSCRALDNGSSAAMPEWLAAGEAPYATEILARGILGACGMELTAVKLMRDDVTLEVEWPNAERVRALAPLCAVAQLFGKSDRLVLQVRGEEAPLITVETSSFKAFSEADEAVKDLALFAPLYSAGVAGGCSPDELIDDVLALSIALIAAVDVPRLKLALGIGNPAPFVLLERRLAYITGFVRERSPRPPAKTRKALKALSDARAASFFVRRNDPAATQKLTAALSRAVSWAGARGYRWPPL